MHSSRWMNLVAAFAIVCCLGAPAWADEDPQITATVTLVNEYARIVAPLDVDPQAVKDPHSAARNLRLRSKMLTKFAAKLQGQVGLYPPRADRATERLQLALDADSLPPVSGSKVTVRQLRSALPKLLAYASEQAHADLERAAFFESMPAVDNEDEVTRQAELDWRLNRR